MHCAHLAHFGQPLWAVKQLLSVPTGTQVLLKPQRIARRVHR